jgi:hypothetical protein
MQEAERPQIIQPQNVVGMGVLVLVRVDVCNGVR